MPTTTAIMQDALQHAGLVQRAEQTPTTFWKSLNCYEQQASVDTEHFRNFSDGTLWHCQGLVHQHWNEKLLPAMIEFAHVNWDKIFRKHEWNGNLRCWMLGATIGDAVPVVQMFCEKKRVFKRFLRTLCTQKWWISSGFKLIWTCDRDAEYTAVTTGDKTTSEDENDTGGDRMNLIGRPAFINGPTFKNVATLTGQLTVLDQAFVLTTCHAFIERPIISLPRRRHETPRPDCSQESLWERSQLFDIQDWSSNCSENDSDSDSEAESREANQYITLAEASISVSADALVPESRQLRTGTFFPTYSLQSPGSDEIHDVRCYSHELDWAVVALDPKHKYAYNSSYSYHGVDRTVVAQSGLPVKGQLLLIARQAKSQRLVKYTDTSVLLSPPGSQSLCRAYTVTEENSYPSKKDQAMGESGALVLDPDTGGAYGMIIARSSFDEELYVVPIADILKDVSRNFPGETARFLNTSDLDTSRQPDRGCGSKQAEISFEECVLGASNGLIDIQSASRILELLKTLGLPDERRNVRMIDVAVLRKNLGESGGWEKQTVERVFRESNTGFRLSDAAVKASVIGSHTALLTLMPLIAWLWDAPTWFFEEAERSGAPKARRDFDDRVSQFKRDRRNKYPHMITYEELLVQAVRNGQSLLLDDLLPYRVYCTDPAAAEAGALVAAMDCTDWEMIGKFLEIVESNGAKKEPAAAMSSASFDQEARTVERLIRSGMVSEARDGFGGGIDEAATKGDMETVKAFIEAGASASQGLLRAAKNGHDVAAFRLLEEGLAEVDFRDSGNLSRQTPLHVASENGELAVVDVLLRHNAEVSARDRSGYTALHTASFKGHVSVVERLLKADATSIVAMDDLKETALHQAGRMGRARVVEVLLQHGAGCNIQSSHGSTALHLASRGGYAQATEVLLQHEAALDLRDFKGETALHMAIKSKDPATVDLLLRRGADVNARNILENNALDVAIQGTAHSIVEKLLQHGTVDLSAKDSMGETALHLASRSGADSVVNMLLRHGADVNAQNRFGQTALDVARRHSRASVVEILIRPSKADQDTMEPEKQEPVEIAHGARRYDSAGRDDEVRGSELAADVEEDVGGGTRSSPTPSPTMTKSLSAQTGGNDQPKREGAAPQVEGDDPSGGKEGQRGEDEYTSRGHSLSGPFNS